MTMELSEQAYITELEHSIVTYRNMGHPFAGVAALLDLPGGAEQAGQLYQNALEKAAALLCRPTETVEERVWTMLEELGVRRSMRWAEELAAALAMAVRSPELLVNLECGLYKEMGRVLGVKESYMMAHIRRVLHDAYHGPGREEDLYRELGIYRSKDLTPARFLKVAVRYLRAEGAGRLFE